MSEESIDPLQLASYHKNVKIVDIRKDPDGLQIPGSIRMDGGELSRAENVPFNSNEQVVIYCGHGNSSRRAAAALRQNGYHALALDGGWAAWLRAGLPTEPM